MKTLDKVSDFVIITAFLAITTVFSFWLWGVGTEEDHVNKADNPIIYVQTHDAKHNSL